MHQRLPLSGIQELAGKGLLYTTDADIVLLIRESTPLLPLTRKHPVGYAACLLNSEPVRICTLLLMRPGAVQGCHSTDSFHLITMRTLRILERLYWRMFTNVCTRWWLHNGLKCEPQKKSYLTICWFVISMTLLEGPCIAISVACSGPIMVTPRGIT